jgi:hypothetical protein
MRTLNTLLVRAFPILRHAPMLSSQVEVTIGTSKDNTWHDSITGADGNPEAMVLL